MRNSEKIISVTAQALAKNPLGIIALFIVFIYFFASLVVLFANGLTPEERIPLIYFLVAFPILVLIVFAWLVSRHSNKLFAPSDFSNEDNYIKMQMAAIGNLTAASVKNQTIGNNDIDKIIEAVTESMTIGNLPTPNTISNKPLTSHTSTNILWVDDRPGNNKFEIKAFESMGLEISLALSTEEALKILPAKKFAAIISDMGRKEGAQEGYVLLEKIRSKGIDTPYFIYAGSNSPEHKKMALERGAQGSTNNPNELFQSVTRAIRQNNPQFHFVTYF